MSITKASSKSAVVRRVQHYAIYDSGRARFGWRAFIAAFVVPPDDERPQFINRQRKVKQKSGAVRAARSDGQRQVLIFSGGKEIAVMKLEI